MAIPIRVTIECPNCGVSEKVIFGDTSVGPIGRVSETPIYSMTQHDLWPQSRRTVGEITATYLSCASCGEEEFTSLPELARNQFKVRSPEK